MDVYHESSIGFSFAGSSLIAFNAFAYLDFKFKNLCGQSSENNLPDYKSLCEKVKEVAEYSVKNTFLENSNRHVEIILFGYCPKTKKPFICKIKNNASEQAKYELEYLGNGEKINWFVIGNHTQKIENLISKELYSETTDADWYSPIKVLNKVVTEKKHQGIGGGIQIVEISLKEGFIYKASGKETEEGSIDSYVRNVQQDKFVEKIGDCIVNLQGYKIK